MRKLYIIEARNADGSLKFDCPQPESFFGRGAIVGMDDWAMSRPLFAKFGPDIHLNGYDIPNWPKMVNGCWVAREKTW